MVFGLAGFIVVGGVLGVAATVAQEVGVGVAWVRAGGIAARGVCVRPAV